MIRYYTFIMAVGVVVSTQVFFAYSAQESPSDRQSLHFVDAIEQAQRQLAVIEPVCESEEISLPITTGLFVNAEGGVITSIPAVAGADRIFVKMLSSERMPATIKAIDQVLGLAFLKTAFSTDVSLEALDDPAQVGEWVVVKYAVEVPGDDSYEIVPFPALISSNSASINFFGRKYEQMLKLHSKTPKGTATAPVFNTRGHLEGLVIAVRDCGRSNDCTYVISAEKLREAAADLSEGISKRLGWMGIALQTPSEGKKRKGVQIAAVMRGYPADKAGLTPGDTLLAIDNVKINDPDRIRSIINRSEPGQEIVVEFDREGQRRTVSVTLTERPLLICTTPQIK